jgi:hypothetical protein
MKFNKVFHCTRSEKNISYSYYTARKYSYLFIPGPFMNILINLQSKAGRFTAGSSSITENVIIQFARNLNLRIRYTRKKIRSVSLNEIEDLFSLKDILHLLLYTIKRGVKLFTEIINFLFNIY